MSEAGERPGSPSGVPDAAADRVSSVDQVPGSWDGQGVQVNISGSQGVQVNIGGRGWQSNGFAAGGSAAEAEQMALRAWGWSLAGDPEARRHWGPRARGVSIDSEVGYRFQGRSAALRVIAGWLDRDRADRRVLVVTGAPGAGKSAVLGRIVTTADTEAAGLLPRSDIEGRATPGSVACAIHAKGKTALDVAAEIARAASAALPGRIEDFAPALRDALAERNGRRFNVVIDALDEAVSHAETRTMITKVMMPMAETCADVGAQVVVGFRRTDSGGDLLSAFGMAADLIDLDEPEFYKEEDLVAYALATLQLADGGPGDNVYTEHRIAVPVAERIAKLSERNFLVAGMTARATACTTRRLSTQFH